MGVVEQIDLERALQVSLDVDGERVTYPIDPQAMMVTKGTETQIAPYDRQFGSKTVGQTSDCYCDGTCDEFHISDCVILNRCYYVGCIHECKAGFRACW